MGFPRERYCGELPFSSPEDLPNPGIELGSPALQTDSLLTESQGSPSLFKLKQQQQQQQTSLF